MDLGIARDLCSLTNEFYRQVGASFDATRQAPWPGWRRLVDELGLQRGMPLDVLDLACGNLRFERFLVGEGVEARALAIDSCEELVHRGISGLPDVSFLCRDVVAALLDGTDPLDGLDRPCFDLAVCFGFLHHVPMADCRLRVVRALGECVRPGGVVAVSLWQFARDARLLAKAIPVEGGDAGDFLLGWQEERNVWRYCHSFGEDEVDDLARLCSPQLREFCRFSSDGRSGDLNRYLVLRREA